VAGIPAQATAEVGGPQVSISQMERHVDAGRHFHRFPIQFRWLISPLAHGVHRGLGHARIDFIIIENMYIDRHAIARDLSAESHRAFDSLLL
jgi:hypothetical protein